MEATPIARLLGLPKFRATPRTRALLVALALLALVFVGAYFRTLNIRGWDGGTGFHPDERYIQYTVAGLRVPPTWRDYFRTTCPSPLPAPRNPSAPPDKLEPSTDSGCSTLNPRNFDWSRNFQYGSLPLTLTRLVAETTERTDASAIVVTGRMLGALADTITIVTVFFLGCLVFNRRVGLLAAAFYACAAMPIQQAHYFTTDSWAVCFGALALLWITRLALRGGWANAVLSGVCIGAAMACKINMASLALLVPLAAAQQGIGSWGAGVGERANSSRLNALLRSLGLLVLSGAVAFIAFRLLQPDAFAGPNWWNIALDERFRTTTREARLTANGTRDLPYLIQWTNRARWWYGWQNMVVWGMGVPLGVAAWVGVAAAGWQIIARRHVAALVPFIWVLGYFGWIGAQLLMTMRYFLPLYPALTVFAAWILVEGWQALRKYPTLQRWQRMRPVFNVGRWHPKGTRVVGRWSFIVPLAVLITTFGWAWAYTRIYTQPYTRVAAADWLRQQEPDGATITFEVWDDPLPFASDPQFKQIPTAPYAEEEPDKYLRTDNDIDKARLIPQLAQADYVVLTSPRVYGSVSRMPQRYPAINRYYRALFDGSLGFEQAAQFTSFPHLGTVRIDDTGAEEAFWVYDHPRVTIFRRTAAFDPQRAYQLIAGDGAWDEVYRGLRPSQLNDAPTALLLTDAAWQHWQARSVKAGAALGSVGAVVEWLLAIEVLGVAMWGMLWRLRLPLPDRGLSLGRMVGVALWAVPPALLAATVAPLSRPLLAGWYVLVVLGGGLSVWRERRALLAFVRRRPWHVWAPQALYAAVLLLGFALLAPNDPLVRPQLAARWAALVGTLTLPAPDLFFAGGHDPLPYAAQLPFALLNKLLAIAPIFGLRLATATALALALVGVWTAAQSVVRPRFDRAWQAILLLLVVLPGVALGNTWGFSSWLALLRFDVDLLGVVALAATAVALGMGVAHARSMLFMLPLLVLLRGYGVPTALAAALAIAAMARTTSRTTRLSLSFAAVLVGALVVGAPLAWNVAPYLQNDGVFGALLGWVLGLLAPFVVLAWFGLGANTRQQRGVWTLVLAALALLVLTVLVQVATSGGAAPYVATIAALLVIMAAGRALAALQHARQHAWLSAGRRWAMLAGAVLLVLGTLATTAGTGAQAAIEPTVQRAAARVPAGDGVLVAAPQAAAEWSAALGMPALIAAPEREARLRSALAPAIDGVIAGRRSAINVIYDADPAQTQRTLQTYHVGYVVLGPTERAVFPAAAATFQTLAAQNIVDRVYDENDVVIYRHRAPATTPPFVAQTLNLQPPAEQSLLLAQPVGTLPAVNEYAWNDLANQYPLLGILLWLLVIEVLGLLVFPIVRRVWGRWHDGGWGVSKLVGLLLWGYLVWLPVSLGWWNFTRWSLVWSALLLGAGGWGLGVRKWWLGRRAPTPNFQPLTPRAKRAIVRSELCFLAAFALWALVRAANPDVWHPIYGGEKPFEFGFLNAILRSPNMPPYDPFFSDGIINYYYYGLFLMALPIKAVGIAPAVGFNLAIATVFAFTITAALALGREIGARWRWGVLTVFFLMCVGPLASVLKVGEGRGLNAVLVAFDGGGLAGLGARLGAWFWGPSRIITTPGYTINEFPLFSFLFADLHPHLIMLPVTLLAIACAWELSRRRPTALAIGLGALVLGTLAVANSWDAPTYALVIGGALVGRTWQRARGRVPARLMITQLGLASLLAVAMLVGGIMLYWPFFSQYQAQVGGIGFVQQGDRVRDWALWFGPVLFIAVSLLGVLLWRAAQQADVRWRGAARGVAIAVPLLPVALLLSGFVTQGADDGLALRLLLGVLGGVGVGIALAVRLPVRHWWPLWLITVGLLVALGVQIVFVRDHLAGGSSQRMNTVFKFGFQVWTLWALGAAGALPMIARRLRHQETAFGIWIGVLAILVLPGLIYPLAGVPSRLATRFDQTQPLTLDGLAFMDRATYRYANDDQNVDASIDLQPDADAIRWLNENISGTPVFLTSEKEFYRAYGMRIAANTGLPTVLGKLHQDEQRDPAVVRARERDVQTLWNTADMAQTQQLLRTYRVEYVYVGPIERALYQAEGIVKWAQMDRTLLSVAYQNSGVTIYRVDQVALANAAGGVAALAPASDVETVLDAALAADPADTQVAFALGQQLLERDRAADAVRALEPAVRAHPDDVPLHHLWGDALARAGRPDDALVAWQHAVDVDRTPNTLTELGRELIKLDRFGDAERTLNEALALDPDFAEALWGMGVLFRARNASGDRERAVAQFQQCVERAAADSPWRAEALLALDALGVDR